MKSCLRNWRGKDVDGMTIVWRGSTSFWDFQWKALKAKS